MSCSLIFGLVKDNPADKMLFNDLTGGDYAGVPPKTDPEVIFTAFIYIVFVK